MKALLSGNEALARGAYEAGVTVVAGYPGTPSTEILESLARYEDIHAEWAPNEKVALEVAAGAALAGARSLAVMKHVGVNVAADPLMTAAYIGVKGGLVLVSADDPGMFSSQNEQDNRHFARFAKIPLLEPSDSQEAKDFMGVAYEISEAFDTPVMIRTTTRLSHTRCPVMLGGRRDSPIGLGFDKNPEKCVMIPANARQRHPVVEQRLLDLEAYAVRSPLNRIEWLSRDRGFVVSGVAYNYVKEVFPGDSVLKLGMTHPLPKDLVRAFANGVGRLYIVEELDPFIEEQVKAMGYSPQGKNLLPLTGEYTPEVLAYCLLGETVPAGIPLTPRPPVLCPGCGHRAAFWVLGRLGLTVTGDIGCYTLAASRPLQTMDTCACMGAGIGHAHGISRALGKDAEGKVVATIGDSTFFHSGITGLLNMVYNGGNSTVIIMDNSTTAMTGHQNHPGTGYTAKGAPACAVDIAELARGLGVQHVQVADPYNLKGFKSAVKGALAHDGPSVVVARRACALMDRKSWKPSLRVDVETCTGCGLCFNLGCPAITEVDGKAQVDQGLCTGCGVCKQVCAKGAIQEGVGPS